MSVDMECPCDIVGCQPSRELTIEGLGRFVHCPKKVLDYIHVEGDTWKVWTTDHDPKVGNLDEIDLEEEPSIWGPTSVENDHNDLEAAAIRRLNSMVQKSVEEVTAAYINKPTNDDMIEDMSASLEEQMKSMVQCKSLTDSKVAAHQETWTTMKGVSAARGMWNRYLCRVLGSTIKDVKWYHLLFGYKLQARSFINLEPSVVDYNPTGEEGKSRFLYEIDEEMWTDNARTNASFTATIQTPKTIVDLHIMPNATVKSVNVNFNISKDEGNVPLEK